MAKTTLEPGYYSTKHGHMVYVATSGVAWCLAGPDSDGPTKLHGIDEDAGLEPMDLRDVYEDASDLSEMAENIGRHGSPYA